MNHPGMRELRAFSCVLLASVLGLVPGRAEGQLAAVVDSGTRYAGNSTGSSGFNQDAGTASSTTLNAPSYAVLDSSGDLFLSDTQNNCVRKVDTAGNVTTVAGLRVNGGPDTCNAALNPTPTPAQGLLKPTGLAIDSAGTLYISDSQHNCVRTLAAGAVDSYASNELGTAAGTCTATDTASVTPVPNGLAVDASGNLYISVQDTAASTPVNQVLLHASGASASAVCMLAGQPSANVATTCSGVSGTATLSSPAGLAIDPMQDLFIADTGNNCVRELAGMTTLATAVGGCANDGSGSASTALQSPYGLAVTPGGMLLISEAAPGMNQVVSFSAATSSLSAVAGLPSGASGGYSTSLDGQSTLSTPLNQPLGLTTNANGDIFLADSGNNVVRRLSANLNFGSEALGATSAAQTITFAVYRAANLSASVGTDYSITANTCSGSISPASAGNPPATCQVTVAFTPTEPGVRTAALTITDSGSGAVASSAAMGTGIGPLSLLTPGVSSTVTSGLDTPIGISVDSSGDIYVLEQGSSSTNSDVVLFPAGGAERVVVPQGSGVLTPTAMAVDGAGNIFLADGINNTIARFGADGSVNLSYATGLVNASALAVDSFDNLYVAEAGSAQNVVEIYAGGGRRVIAGGGTTAAANGIPATQAELVRPTGLALEANGTVAISDAGAQYVYTVDASGTIRIVAGNGSSISTNTAQATGTAILYPVGLVYDAAGDLYVADEAANQVYKVFPVQSSGSNIITAFGSGASGNTDGSALSASTRAPLTIALDGSSDLYVVDSGNSSVREVTYPSTNSIDFGDVIIGNSPTVNETIVNAGDAAVGISTPITTTDGHFTISSSSTCGSSLAAGGFCTIGYTFTPTVQGTVTATSTVTTTSSNSPFTINLTGFGLTTQTLPYTLPMETEVYGQPFNQTVQLNVIYPDLAPDGTMSFAISGNQTCSTSAPFPTTVVCNAPNSHLHVLGSPYNVNFAYAPNPSDAHANYYAATGSTTLSVTPAPLTVTTANVTKNYGDPVQLPSPSATFSAFSNGDQFTAVGSTTATATSPVGTYTITSTVVPIGSATTSDYNITYIAGTLTVLGRPLTVTIADASRPYGAANPTFSSTIANAANGDTFTVTYSTTATTTSPVGTYQINATVTGTNIANYSVTVVAGTLTVTPIPLTVNVANATRPYGAANPSFSANIVGAINGDTFTQTFSTTATINSPVGAYPINDALSGPAASNYTITVNPGTLTITKAAATLTVSANNATRSYGAANPAFTSTISGALNGDTFTITYTTTATVTSPVGSYSITPVVSGAAAANYNVVTNDGVLIVAPAALTVTVNSVSRPFGANNPVLTGVVAGIQNNDAISVVYSTTATTASAPGVYPITATVSGAALSNYTVNVAPGALTVGLTATTVTLTSSSATVNSGSPVTFTANVSSADGVPTGTVTFTSGNTLLGTVTLDGTGTATFSTSSLPSGTLTITATYSGSSDYSGSSASVTQIVSPGSFTLSATPPTQFVRGAGTTTYVITATSVNGYSGPVALTCAGLPADASCSFSTATVTLTAGGSANATMTVTNTASDAKLRIPEQPRKPSGGTGLIAFAAVLPFELTGIAALFAGLPGRRRRSMGSSRKMRLLLMVLCTAGLLGLAGCACFTSVYQNYTINVSGTTTVQGVTSQATSVILSVGQP